MCLPRHIFPVVCLALNSVWPVLVASSQSNHMISGGIEAIPNEFPWLVYITTNTDICSGIILTQDWILTTQSCSFYDYDTYTITAGEHDVRYFKGMEQSRTASYIISHPDVGEGWYTHDIAVIRVSPPFNFNRWVRQAKLMKPGTPMPDEVILAGWGSLDFNNFNRAPFLLKRNLTKVPEEQCSDAPEDIICYGERGDDFGNDGNILMCGDDLAVCGILPANNNGPRHTSVGYHYDWIMSMITAKDEDEEPVQTNLNCGGEISATSGRILFSVEEELVVGTLCMWTVKTDLIRTRWVLKYSGVTESDELYITKFNVSAAAPEQSIPISDWNPEYLTESGVYIITLVVHNQGAKGIDIEFYTSGIFDIAPRPLGFEVRNTSLGTLKHPKSGLYHDDERSLFVISPEKSWERYIAFSYMSVWTSDNCSMDAVIIYTWEERGFKNLGRYCGFDRPSERPEPVYIQNGNALVAFWTSHYDHRFGFEINWF